MPDRIESVDHGSEFGFGSGSGRNTLGRNRETLERNQRPGPSHRESQAEQSTEDGGVVKTGTTTVAVAGSDGVVLAADTRASIGGGRFVANRTTQKIEPIGDRAAVAFSGSVSDAQSFVRQLRAEARLYELEHGTAISLESLATLAGGLVRRGPYRVLDLLLAGVEDGEDREDGGPESATDTNGTVSTAVYDIGPGGGVMTTDYAASGSGMQLAYGALEGTIGATPNAKRTVGDLRPAIVGAVRSATARDTASGDGMTIATITTDGVELERFDDLETVGTTVGGDGQGSEDEAVGSGEREREGDRDDGENEEEVN